MEAANGSASNERLGDFYLTSKARPSGAILVGG